MLMKMSARMLLLLLLLCAVSMDSLLPLTSACDTIIQESVTCSVDDEDIDIEVSCPENYKIELTQVAYLIAKSPQCPTVWEPSSCVAERGLEHTHQASCIAERCTFTITAKNRGFVQALYPACQGVHYVGTRYTCTLSDMAPVIRTCNKESITANRIRIENPPDTQHPCACQLSLDPASQLLISRKLFTDPNAASCDYTLVTWSTTEDAMLLRQPLCNQGGSVPGEVMYGCGQHDGMVHLQHDTDQETFIYYLIEVTVPPLNNLTVQCGLNDTDINSTQVIMTTTTQRRRTTTRLPSTRASLTTNTAPTAESSSSGLSDGVLSAIIAIAVIAALIVIIVIILVAFRERRQRMMKPRPPTNTFNATLGNNYKGRTFTVGDKDTMPRIKAPTHDSFI